jgi:hypothetical protein
MEYYSATKKNESRSFAGKWMKLESIHNVKWNNPGWGSQIRHVLSRMWHLVLKNEWQECETSFVWGWGAEKGWGQKDRMGVNIIKILLIWKNNSETCWICSKKWGVRIRGNDGGDRFDRGALYANMETSQWNPFVEQRYTTKKWKKNPFNICNLQNTIAYQHRTLWSIACFPGDCQADPALPLCYCPASQEGFVLHITCSCKDQNSKFEGIYCIYIAFTALWTWKFFKLNHSNKSWTLFSIIPCV